MWPLLLLLGADLSAIPMVVVGCLFAVCWLSVAVMSVLLVPAMPVYSMTQYVVYRQGSHLVYTIQFWALQIVLWGMLLNYVFRKVFWRKYEAVHRFLVRLMAAMVGASEERITPWYTAVKIWLLCNLVLYANMICFFMPQDDISPRAFAIIDDFVARLNLTRI